MDLNDVIVFARVAETRSFTGAAELLGIPKSTVSRRLAQLEERLGVRLIQRTTRRLALTDVGEAYYQRAARIVADLAAAEQLVTDMQATPRGRLRVTAPVNLSSQHLGAMIAAFLAAHPDVNVELDATDRVVDLIEEGFDLAIRFGALPESTLIARRLGAFDSLLVAAPAYLAARGAPATIDDLDDHDKALFVPGARAQAWTLINGDLSHELGRPARLVSSNILAVRDAALAGAGITFIAEFMVARELADGRLVRVLPEWRGRPTDVNAVYPARQNLPPRLARFLDHLVTCFDAPPWRPPDRGRPA